MAKLRMIVHEDANADIEHIYKYISEELCNPTAANQLLGKIKKGLKQIRELPFSCPRLDNDDVEYEDIRKLIIDNYIVFYQVDGDVIHIVRVIFGMRNYVEILSNNNEND